MSSSTAACVLAAGLLPALLALPASAGARWTRISSVRSASEPYLACPEARQRAACRLIVDPTAGTRRRGPVAEGAITRGPEQEVSPALFGHGVEGGYSPEDLRRAYGLPSTSAGSGETVAVVDAYDDPKAESDLSTYRATYGIPPCTADNGCFRKVDQSGGTSYPAPDRDWAGEISLDLDMVSAICPNCHILLVEANSNLARDLAAAENEAVALGATEVSNSFGAQLPSEPPQYASAYAHPGTPITASGGDRGYGANVPAANPHVIAVGGTALVPASNSRGWTETVWYRVREGQVHGTGSGCSEEEKPAWQADTGCSFRTTNDVAAVADPNTPVSAYDSYLETSPWHLVGGTSVGAPIIAAAMALADPYTRSFDGAQALYLEAAANGTGALEDVTSGSNGACGSYLCQAGPGFDGPTGLGSLFGAPNVAPASVHLPAVVTEGASAVTATSATVHGSVNPNGRPVTGCYFVYGRSQARAQCATLPGSGEEPVPVSASLHTLIAGSAYSFQIVATNAGGSSYGAIQTFTTLSRPLVQAPPLQPLQTTPPLVEGPLPVPDARLAAVTLQATNAGIVKVRVSCPAREAVCAGRIAIRTRRPVSVRAGRHRAAKRILTLASGSFTVTGGHLTTLALHLPAAARSLLAHLRVVLARATLVAHDYSGATHVTQTNVTLRAPARHRRG